MKGKDFKVLTERLKNGDQDAWLMIEAHMGILISRMARREKIESAWIATDSGIQSIHEVQDEIVAAFKVQLLACPLEVKTYERYKSFVLEYTDKILKERFKVFYRLIVSKDHKAWQIVNERLYIYAAKWLSDMGLMGEEAQDIYQNSVITFYEKLIKGGGDFETSREFKSYYFRFLELKTMESKRKQILFNQRHSKIELKHLFRPVTESVSEMDDMYFYIEKIMREAISKEEVSILKSYYFHGDKLKDIARQLEISEVSCRQKKFQALRKIAKIYKELEAVQLNQQSP